jgi:uncharacterized spore protein YtfJ
MTDQPTGDQNTHTAYDPNQWAKISQEEIDKFLEAAKVEAVYGQPIMHGEQMMIPTAEIISGLGIGFGGGSGTAPQQEGAGSSPAAGSGSGGGGGGGGRVFSRPVAVVIASPEGVRVEPVVDVTKLGLAALTAFGFMAAMMARMGSRRRMLKALREQGNALK